MRQRIAITALAATAIVGVLTGSAAASEMVEELPSAEEAAASDSFTEPAQRFCGSDSSTPVESSEAAVRVRQVESARSGDECSSALVYYCRTARVARYQRSLLGFILFRYWHWKRWCWRYPRILSIASGTYLTDVDANMQYRGELPGSDNWYVWCCKSGTSGHASRRQAHLENCIFRYGCLSNFYPWVKINAHADGSYTWRTGI